MLLVLLRSHLLLVMVLWIVLVIAEVVIHKHAHLLQLFDLLCAHHSPLPVHQVVQIDLSRRLIRRG